jgi:Tol biopolymer transport system component
VLEALARRPWQSCLQLALAMTLWLLLPASAHAGNPDLKWRTLETDHFYVHYQAGNEIAAERTAMIAEKAYAELTEAWGHRVFLKTHIRLTDGTDTANGTATASPFPLINAFTTAPETLSVLESYDDWLDILITHELVHVVHLDTVHGLARAVNAVLGLGVLGKVMQPNVVQPRWVVEGVATMYESKYSSQGRRKSAQFDAMIRMAVLDGTFQSIDQVSSGARVFPHGTNVYLYGLHFMHYIYSRYGERALRDLSHLYARQIVPYGINKAIQKVTGVTFYQLWKEFKEDTVTRFQAQARRIRARGLRQGRRLTFAGETTRYPMWSNDDDWIYFYKEDGHREEGLKRLKSSGGRVREGVGIGRQGADVDIEHVIDIEDPGESSFVGATGDVVYDQTQVYDFRYSWSDLWRWNGGDPKQAEQLTFGLRATEPHVSPDGRTVAFRRNDAAQSRLAFLDLDTTEVRELAPFDRVSQVYTPRWHPDGVRVAFSAFRDGGYRDIYVFDRETERTVRITADRFMDLAPTWSPDGRYLLFTSDRDQVFNIYAYDMETSTLHQVSNVLGGAFEPSVSHDGSRIAYVGYGKNGFDLWVMPFDPERWLEPMGPVTNLAVTDDPAPEIDGQNGRPLSLSSRRYRPIETFFPRVIFPTALDFQSSQFGTGLGFSTGVQDVLGFHTVGLNFNYDTNERVATTGVSYSYDRLFPTFTFFFGRGFSRRSGFTRYDYEQLPGGIGPYRADQYRERSTVLLGQLSLPIIRHARHRASFDAGYSWTRWTNLDAGDVFVDPNAPATLLPEVGDAAQVDLGLGYSNESDGGGRYTYGSEQGRGAGVGVSVVDRKLGGDFNDVQARASYQETIPMPWRGHQSLFLRVEGGAAAGGFRNRGSFCVGEQNFGLDAIQALLGRVGFGTACRGLVRGYGLVAARGRYYARATAAYRIPLYDVDRGIGTLPFFFTRVGLVPFVDVANAWDNPTDIRKVLVGAGSALVFSFRLGYAEGINLILHYAHGFDPDLGLDLFRVVVSTSF